MGCWQLCTSYFTTFPFWGFTLVVRMEISHHPDEEPRIKSSRTRCYQSRPLDSRQNIRVRPYLDEVGLVENSRQ